MSDLADLTDRHFRPDPGEILAPPAEARLGRIVVCVERQLASCVAGQHTLWMLCNLLARQFGLVTAIHLDVPTDVLLLPDVAAFGEAPKLGNCLMNCVSLIAASYIEVDWLSGTTYPNYDIAFSVGHVETTPNAAVQLAIFADGWRAYIGASSSFPKTLPASESPLGPYIAAALAAGEGFKRLRGLKAGKGRFIDESYELYISLWSGATASSWDELAAGFEPKGITLPPFYFAGAGAVAQAAALALTGVSANQSHVTIVDHDPFDVTNNNRYILSILGDKDRRKTDILADFLRRRGISCFTYAGKWEAFTDRNSREHNRSELDVMERRYRYEVVLSCVDKNTARHAIQNLWPKLIIGGSTYGLAAKAITYDMSGPEFCLKCYNPQEDRNAVALARLEEARLLSAAKRVDFFKELGVDPDVASQYLSAPRCGQLSESDVERFAAGEPMMSVGFVSASAGVLLAAQFIKQAMVGRNELVAFGSQLTMTFGKPSIRWINTLPQSGCDCVTRRAFEWAQLWSTQA